MMEGYVPIATYAAATGRSHWTIRRWCHEGSIDARRNGHGNWEIAQIEVDRAIAARAEQPLGRARDKAERLAAGAIRAMWTIILPGSAPSRGLTHPGCRSIASGAADDKASSRPPRLLPSHIALALIVIVAAAVILLGLALSEPAAALPQSEWRDWAGKQADVAKRERARLVRMTDALGMRRPAPLPTPAQYTCFTVDPVSGEEIGFIAWRDFGVAAQKAASAYRRFAKACKRRLVNPGGESCDRWWPLARYVGWPRAQKSNVIHCIRGESGGDPRCTGALGEAGLMQIHPVHARAFRRVTGKPFYRAAWAPEHNLRFGLWLWRGSGWRPWSVMR